MDSILIKRLDRIYRIIRIFCVPGFRMKPGTQNPLRGVSSQSHLYYSTILLLKLTFDILQRQAKCSFSPQGGCYFHGFIRKP
jgi:hypothetical protein